jgi:hypothetical protein
VGGRKRPEKTIESDCPILTSCGPDIARRGTRALPTAIAFSNALDRPPSPTSPFFCPPFFCHSPFRPFAYIFAAIENPVVGCFVISQRSFNCGCAALCFVKAGALKAGRRIAPPACALPTRLEVRMLLDFNPIEPCGGRRRNCHAGSNCVWNRRPRSLNIVCVFKRAG